MDAAEQLAQEEIDAEVIDLRTIVPPDLDTVLAGCEKTGRLVVAAEDRSFAGFVRTIQGRCCGAFSWIPNDRFGAKECTRYRSVLDSGGRNHPHEGRCRSGSKNSCEYQGEW